MAKPQQKLSKREKELIAALFAEGKTDEQVAKVIGLHRDTFQKVMKRNGLSCATKPAKERAKKKIGRPTKFKKKFIEQVEDMAMIGLPDKDIATLLGIEPPTIVLWKETRPEFLNAILRGRAKGHKSMTKAMHDRGCGFEREEEIVSVNKKTGEIYKETVTKYYPPDPTCMQYYLGNRHKESWASIQRIEASVENIPAINFVPAVAVKKVKNGNA